MTNERKQQMLEYAMDQQCAKLLEVCCSNLVTMGRYKAEEAAKQGISNLVSAETIFKTALEL